MTLQWRVGMGFSKKLCKIIHIKNIEKYQTLVEDWIEFYNTKRLKYRKKSKIFSLGVNPKN